jgi:hypothetical protein
MGIIHRPVFYLKLNSHSRFVRNLQETHYIPLRSQQVNDIYRFVTMIY